MKPIATLKEKDSFKLARRDAKQELRTVSNRRQKAAPGQVLERVIGPPGEELPPEDLPGKKP